MNIIDQVKQTLIQEIEKVFNKRILLSRFLKLKSKFQKIRKMETMRPILRWC